MFAPPAPPGSQRHESDSDSDWSDDDDYGVKKINIRIKPVAQMTPSKISASVEELRATVGTWKSLANVNLAKPKSRRHHQSTAFIPSDDPYVALGNGHQQLALNNNNNNIEINNHVNYVKLPVAFAIQECLNAKLTDESSSMIVGRLKMAVPPSILGLDPSRLEPNLVIFFSSRRNCDKAVFNEQFIHKLDENRLNINMLEIQSYARESMAACDPQSEPTHILLPELMKYITTTSKEPKSLCPLFATGHWLCDPDITKVRVDLGINQELLDEIKLSTTEISNLRISIAVSGGVVSHQSKPEASWNPHDSRLTWSFANLAELNGQASCMARFNLTYGPSRISEIELQFTVPGKTITGSQVTLEPGNFKLARCKFEVRTGSFKC